MKNITPFLRFDNQAQEAVNFYTSLFEKSSIGTTARYDEAGAKVSGRPEGSVMTMGFTIHNQEFIALNGGPEFSFTPAISFMVHCDTEEEIDRLRNKFIDGGFIMMPLQEYPFSKKFGRVQDKFGVSRQFILSPNPQKIRTCLMFVGDQAGRTGEAINFYTNIFPNSETKSVINYENGESQFDPITHIKHSVFSINGQEFVAMDSGMPHQFGFSQAISLLVNCDTQEEIDRLRDSLLQGGTAQQCGWLKDKFGIARQIIPSTMGSLMSGTSEQSQRVMKSMLQMVKINMNELKKAYDGE